jgi:tetratricopeptide (TPR) repeat protein
MESHDRLLTEAISSQTEGRLDEANRLYRQVLAANPQNATAWHNLGLLCHERGDHQAAISCLLQSIEVRPDNARTHSNLAAILEFVGQFDEAIDRCRQALVIQPEYPGAHHNMGYILTAIGDFNGAAASYDRALELDAGLAKARYHRATLALLAGDWQKGWDGYEARWEAGRLPKPMFSQPQWSREKLDGRTILVHTEQGFGDTFQFIRYAPLVKEQRATVVVECARPLLPLLATCPGIDQLIGAGDELPAFDFHCPLLSLPGAFQTRLETIPANVPYLFVEQGLVEQWREKLKGVSGFRIGINWQGRSGQGYFRRRDFPLESFEPLAKLPGLRLINLHKGEGRKELAGWKDRLAVIDPGDDVDKAHGAFMDTAAIMMNLDLVITSDTSIAHLAGALGVPVWLALPFVPDWRWLLARSDSPWYPTMRLFRQKSLGDWASVFAEMEAALWSRCAGEG